MFRIFVLLFLANPPGGKRTFYAETRDAVENYWTPIKENARAVKNALDELSAIE